MCVSDRGKGRQRQAILGEHPSSYSDNGYGKTKIHTHTHTLRITLVTESAALHKAATSSTVPIPQR